MTPVFLLENLQQFIKESTSDMILPVRTRTGSNEAKERAVVISCSTGGSITGGETECQKLTN